MNPQAPESDLQKAFDRVQRSGRRSREIAREHAKDLAILKDRLKEAGVEVGAPEVTTGSNGAEGDDAR